MLDCTFFYARAAQRSSGSHVDKMLSDNSRVGTLEKLVMPPTSELELLVKAGRLDIAAETNIVDERFAPIVPLRRAITIRMRNRSSSSYIAASARHSSSKRTDTMAHPYDGPMHQACVYAPISGESPE